MNNIFNKNGTSVPSKNISNSATIGVALGHTDPILSSSISGDVVIQNKLIVDGIDVGAVIQTMQERFLILEADFKAHEEYPALKDAYNQYKMLEKLLMENKKDV